MNFLLIAWRYPSSVAQHRTRMPLLALYVEDRDQIRPRDDRRCPGSHQASLGARQPKFSLSLSLGWRLTIVGTRLASILHRKGSSSRSRTSSRMMCPCTTSMQGLSLSVGNIPSYLGPRPHNRIWLRRTDDGLQLLPMDIALENLISQYQRSLTKSFHICDHSSCG